MIKLLPNKDEFGVKLKYPKRSCKECRKYPCFDGMTKCLSDFAKYGCKFYAEPIVDR